MHLKILTGSVPIFILLSVVASSPMPKVPEHPVLVQTAELNETSEHQKTYKIRLEQLSEGLVPEEFLANWIANYIMYSLGIGLNGNNETDDEYQFSGENSTMDEFEDSVRFKSLINMDSAFGPCPKGRRRDKQGNCRKQFSG